MSLLSNVPNETSTHLIVGLILHVFSSTCEDHRKDQLARTDTDMNCLR